MRSLHSTPRFRPRRRRALAAVAATIVLGIVVLANQPSASNAAHPQARTAAARPVGRTDTGPPRTPAPVLAVLHRHAGFTNETASHNGAPAVDALAGILVDVDTGAILWARDPHRALPPASTTKVLSALVALENYAPDMTVTVTADALHQAGDETRMGLGIGNRLTVRELLTGMLLVSGNDAADALAVDTAGRDAFVAAMNRQLEALGLHDSHFVTPVGLDDPAQLASAYDLAAVAATDVTTFPAFRQIVSQTYAVLPGSDLHAEFDLTNLNRLLRIYPAATGIKPGWTGDAGACLVGMAERDGHRLISVLLHSARVFTDSRDLLDWGFVEEGLPSLIPPPTPKR